MGRTSPPASWQTEAAMRMLMNNLDDEVAEKPGELVVYGGIGRAARDWACYDKIVATLKTLSPTETLLVQSGKPVGVFQTHADAPRVLIANSNLVGKWSDWDRFHELDRKGLMMYGQMTAGSWIYIGSQGIVQGTYETFVEAGRQHFNGDLSGKWILTGGLGGMGGAQPLAATMAGAAMLGIECQPSRIEKRIATGYLDKWTKSLDEALAMIAEACAKKQAISVGLLGNAAEIFPELARRTKAGDKRARPDIVTDQTSAHDPLNGYLPVGWTLDQHEKMKASDPEAVVRAAKSRWRCRCARCSRFIAWVFPRSTTATTSARWRRRWASPMRSIFPASCRPISGRCSAAASGRSAGRHSPAIPKTSIAPTRA